MDTALSPAAKQATALLCDQIANRTAQTSGVAALPRRVRDGRCEHEPSRHRARVHTVRLSHEPAASRPAAGCLGHQKTGRCAIWIFGATSLQHSDSSSTWPMMRRISPETTDVWPLHPCNPCNPRIKQPATRRRYRPRTRSVATTDTFAFCAAGPIGTRRQNFACTPKRNRRPWRMDAGRSSAVPKVCTAVRTTPVLSAL